MKTLITLLITLFFFSTFVFSQTRASTDDGRKVMLSDDGTWFFVEDAAPSTTLDISCASLIEIREDAVSGWSRPRMKEALVISKDRGKGGIGISMFLSKKTVVVAMTVAGASSCIDEDDKAHFLFRDGTRMEEVNYADFNCNNRFVIYYGDVWGRKSNMNTLSTKEIKTLRVWTSDGYVQEDFTPEQSKIFMTAFGCLTNY